MKNKKILLIGIGVLVILILFLPIFNFKTNGLTINNDNIANTKNYKNIVSFLFSFIQQQVFTVSYLLFEIDDTIELYSVDYLDCNEFEVSMAGFKIYKDDILVTVISADDYNNCGNVFVESSFIPSVTGYYDVEVIWFLEDKINGGFITDTTYYSNIFNVLNVDDMCIATSCNDWILLNNIPNGVQEYRPCTRIANNPPGCYVTGTYSETITTCDDDYVIAGLDVQSKEGRWDCIPSEAQFIKININIQNSDSVPVTFNIEGATPTEFQTSVLGLDPIVVQPGQPGTWVSDLIDITEYTEPVTYTITIKGDNEDRTPTTKLFEADIDVN